MGRPAVFLDRDGTLNVQTVRDGKPYSPASVDEFRLFPGVPEACRRLKAAGFTLVVATNQPNVGRGEEPLAMIEAMHAKLLSLVPEIDLVYAAHSPAPMATWKPCVSPMSDSSPGAAGARSGPSASTTRFGSTRLKNAAGSSPG